MTKLYSTPVFKITSNEINITNNNDCLKVILTLENPESIGYFKTNDARFAYCSTENLRNNVVRFIYEGANAVDLICTLINENMIENSPDIARFQINYKCLDQNVYKYKQLSPLAICPQKQRASDSGIDLHLIEKKSNIGNLTMYGTGLSVQPPTGFYFDLVPRSSITKKGYILANNVGIIDQGYTGEIMVPLLKVDPDAPDLELPCKIVQLIPRRWYNFTGVDASDLTQTTRGEGGFGSTN